ncbi:MAG: pitrilysin family protein [Lutibacter sp.]|nr:pitrilysin family protein [Lutibacter sp.]
MKTRILSLITILFLTYSMSAQIDRSVQPVPGPAPSIKLGKPQTFDLKNGLKVLVVENHKLPRVAATLTIDNSPVFEGDKAGVSSLLGSLFGSGTTSISKDDFNEEVDYLGARISFGSQWASSRSLTKYFPRILELMAEAVQDPLFTQEEFDKQVALLLDGIKSSEKSVGAIAGRVQDALGYGKTHPYGEFMTKETVGNVSLSDVQSFYKQYFRPDNAYLVIVGDIDFNKAKELVEKLFSNWSGGSTPAYTMPSVENVSETVINFIDMPNAVQSEVSVLSSTHLSMRDKDYHAVLLANRIFGGDFNSYLNMNLREAHGYTYGARSSIGNDKLTATLFTSGASVRNAVTDSTVVEIMKELHRIRKEPVTEEALKNVKAAYVGSFVRNVEKPQTIARFALNMETEKLPEDFYETYLDKINAVSIEDIQGVAQKYFSADQARIVIVGKGTEVLPNLEKLPYKIQYFDKEANLTNKPEMAKALAEDISKEAVLEAYFNAIGGLEKIKSVQSTLTIYEATAMGNTVVSTEKRTADKYTNEMAMGGNMMMKVIMSKDGVFMNKQALPSEMASEMKYQLGTFSEIGLLKHKGSKLTGIESVDGSDAYVISTKGGFVSSDVYFDVATGLKVKEVQTISMGGQSQRQEATFSDYKVFDGVKFPETKTGSLGTQSVVYKLIYAQIDGGVSAADFE